MGVERVDYSSEDEFQQALMWERHLYEQWEMEQQEQERWEWEQYVESQRLEAELGTDETREQQALYEAEELEKQNKLD